MSETGKEKEMEGITGMRTLTVVAAILPVTLFSVTLRAQWPDYKTSGVPRTGEGKPVMDGPTPKSADVGSWRRRTRQGRRSASRPYQASAGNVQKYWIWI
jgi:hypothetical protein